MLGNYSLLSHQQKPRCLHLIKSLNIKQEEHKKPRQRFVSGFHFKTHY